MESDNPNPLSGELNLHDPAFAACPHRTLSRLRTACPVAHLTDQNGGPPVTIALSRYDDVLRALRDHESFSSDIGFGATGPAPVHVDPPEHARFREVLKPRFSRQYVSDLEPFVRSEVDRLIESLVQRGACEYQREFAIPLPCSVLLRVMGLPVADVDVLLAIKDEILHPTAANHAATVESRRRGMLRANAYFERAIDERMTIGADDLLTDLAKTITEASRPFTKPEILRICLNLLLGGLDTVTASLGCTMAYLAQNPDQRRRLADSSRPSIARAVRELMRTQAPVMVVPRLTKHNVTIGGVEIRRGTLVMLLLGSASADENVFPNAERVDLERHPNLHVAFGAGQHRCIGERLAQMVLEISLEEWHKKIPDYFISRNETLDYSTVIRSPTRLPLVWGDAHFEQRFDRDKSF